MRIVLLILIGCVGLSPLSLSPITACGADLTLEPGKNYSPKFRQRAFTIPFEETDIRNPEVKSDVWAVIMEIRYEDYTVTTWALASGYADIYVSKGGLFLGGYRDAEVNAAARNTIAAARKLVAPLKQTQEWPEPASPGEIRFYLRKGDTLSTGSATEKQLLAGTHELAPLFRAAWGLVLKYRALRDRDMSTSPPQGIEIR
jgi:hypothetical protein